MPILEIGGYATWSRICWRSDCDHELSPVRDFPSMIKCRRVATRYDKLAANDLAFIQLASIKLWQRVNESTP
jgi:transposase